MTELCRRVVFIRSFYIAPLFWLSGGWWVFPNFVWASCFSCNVVGVEPGSRLATCNNTLKLSWCITFWFYLSIWQGNITSGHLIWLGCHRTFHLPGFRQSPSLQLAVSVVVQLLFVPLSISCLGDVATSHRSADSSASIP